MTVRNLEHLLSPHSVALIGASATPGSVGRIIADNLLSGGFAGGISLINPKYAEIDGVKCHASVASLPAAPDLAIIATPPAVVPSLIAELGAKGTRAAVVITAGFGPDLRHALLEAAQPYCLRIVGPNCLGILLPRLGLNASFAHSMPPRGDLAFLSQSGALATAIIDWAQTRNIGFSHVISMGDMADVDFGDLLDILAGDPQSRAILLYIEQITHAPKFLSAARRAARAKPVIVMKSGRHASGAKAAMSHTGALSGSDAVYDAAFRRAGLLRVIELDQLFEAAQMVSFTPKLEGERLAILTNGGGAGVLAADRLADFDGRLAELGEKTKAALSAVLPATWSNGNPVDIVGDAGPDRYGVALDLLLDDANSDAVLVINCPTALASSRLASDAVVATVAARKKSGRRVKPLLTNWLGDGAAFRSRQDFAKARIPSFQTPDAAIGGFMQLVDYARSQEELMRAPPTHAIDLNIDAARAHNVIAEAIAGSRFVLSEAESKDILDAYGIPVAATITATDPEGAMAAAVEILKSYNACVVKVLSDDITHKSDVGGVRLGLTSVAEVREAARAIAANVARLAPSARLKGFTIEPMIERPQAQMLIVGMSVDETFGPVLLFGAGGTAVEVIKDIAHALPPLDFNLARDLMRQTRIYSLLEGYRDQPAADLDAIAEVLVRVSSLVVTQPGIRELDINPLLADDKGCIALDARIRVADERTSPRRPLAIRPYPTRWEKDEALEEIGAIHLRPVRPEDEALYQRFFERITADDARMRFFTAKPHATHKFLARLTQIDYAREMTFIATSAGGDELLGLASLAADPDYSRAEYGILVRSDLKGRGLGWALMRHLIAYATEENFAELYGDVLAANTTMLRMCKELAFRVSEVAGDVTLRRVTLDLSMSARSRRT